MADQAGITTRFSRTDPPEGIRYEAQGWFISANDGRFWTVDKPDGTPIQRERHDPPLMPNQYVKC